MRGRQKPPVDRVDLPRMDAEFSAETDPARPEHVLREDLPVVDIGRHAVHGGRQPGDPGREHHPRPRVQEFLSVADDVGVQAEIVRTEDQTKHAGTRGDFHDVPDSKGGFDEGQDGNLPGKYRRQQRQVVPTFRFREDDSGDPRAHNGGDVLPEPLRFRSVDPDVDGATR